jgi:hypothetical protein
LFADGAEAEDGGGGQADEDVVDEVVGDDALGGGGRHMLVSNLTSPATVRSVVVRRSSRAQEPEMQNHFYNRPRLEMRSWLLLF